MILRIWAIYDRSKLILGTLVIPFALEIISNIICAVIFSDMRNLSGT